MKNVKSTPQPETAVTSSKMPDRVLAYPAFKNKRDNPYNYALYCAVQNEGVAVGEFARFAVLGESFQIVHIHWPDAITWSHYGLIAFVRGLLFLGRLKISRVRSAKVLWTVHNLKAHNGRFVLIEKWLWRLFIPFVDATIHLSPGSIPPTFTRFPSLEEKPSFVIRHGHYKDLYPNTIGKLEARRRLAISSSLRVITFIGQIKLYKNVGKLVSCFRNLQDEAATLVIAGRPESGGLTAEIHSSIEKATNIIFSPGRVSEADIQLYLNAGDLAVFPYSEILNSGSAILALSFDRPVLVPAKGAMGELRELIGEEWVMTYDGELTSELLQLGLTWATESHRSQSCDLSVLDWRNIGRQTVAAYRETLTGSTR